MSKKVTVPEMLDILTKTMAARHAKVGSPSLPTGPLFSFLLGAGFSVSAGIPSTGHMAAAMQAFSSRDDGEEIEWFKVFDHTENIGPAEPWDYYKLMRESFPLPPARHDFITSAMQWAASKKVPMSVDSVLLASILLAGTGDKKLCRSPYRLQEKDVFSILRPNASIFARHAFTTNFDELLPTTFYLGNRAVDVIDTQGVRNISAAAEYPTVVYLHGRHLHYDIRNTPGELKARRRDPNLHYNDLFAQFRKVLEHTGLIVVGYSGAEDRVIEVIQDALDDPNSLPYGLWWVLYRDEESVSDLARNLVLSSERAWFVVDNSPSRENYPAQEFFEDLCAGIDLDIETALSDWMTSIDRVSTLASSLSERLQQSYGNVFNEAIEAYYLHPTQIHLRLKEFAERAQKIRTQFIDNNPRMVANVLLGLAHLYVRVNDFGLAIAHYQEALELHRKAGDDLGAANDLQGLGDILMRRNDLAGAEEKYKEALELHRKAGYDLGAANDLRGLGDVKMWRGEISAAEEKYKEALELHRKAGDELGAANDLKGLGDVLMRRNELAAAEEKYKEALELHRKAGSDLGVANALQGLGDVLMRGDDLTGAKEKYKEALELHRKAGDELGAANDLKGLGDVLMRRDDLIGAEEKYKEALELHRKVDDNLGAANDLKGLGDVLMRRDDLIGAEEKYKEALELHRKVDDNLGAANDLQGLGDVLMQGDDLTRAEEKYKEALELHRKADDDLGAANDIQGLGDVLMRGDDLTGAEEKYKEALDLHRKADDNLGAAYDLQGLGDILMQRDDLTVAEEKYREALELHKKAGDDLGAGNDLKGLGDVLMRRDDLTGAEEKYKEALELHRKVDDNLGAANDLKGLGDVLMRRDDLTGAEEKYKEALELHRKVDDNLGAANDLKGLGDVLMQGDDLTGAEEKYKEALELHREADDDLGAGIVLRKLGESAIWQDRLKEAAELYSEAIKLDAASKASTFSDYGWQLMLKGYYDESVEKSHESFTIEGNPIPYFNISHAKWLRGDPDALGHYKAGIQQFRPLNEVELADFDEFIKRGLTTSEKVDALKAELGITE